MAKKSVSAEAAFRDQSTKNMVTTTSLTLVDRGPPLLSGTDRRPTLGVVGRAHPAVAAVRGLVFDPGAIFITPVFIAPLLAFRELPLIGPIDSRRRLHNLACFSVLPALAQHHSQGL